MAATILRDATPIRARMAIGATTETRMIRPAVWARPARNTGRGARSTGDADRRAREDSERDRRAPVKEFPAVDLPGHPRQHFLHADVLRALRHALPTRPRQG